MSNLQRCPKCGGFGALEKRGNRIARTMKPDDEPEWMKRLQVGAQPEYRCPDCNMTGYIDVARDASDKNIE